MAFEGERHGERGREAEGGAGEATHQLHSIEWHHVSHRLPGVLPSEDLVDALQLSHRLALQVVKGALVQLPPGNERPRLNVRLVENLKLADDKLEDLKTIGG